MRKSESAISGGNNGMWKARFLSCRTIRRLAKLFGHNIRLECYIGKVGNETVSGDKFVFITKGKMGKYSQMTEPNKPYMMPVQETMLCMTFRDGELVFDDNKARRR
jgi:hypothetical protein